MSVHRHRTSIATSRRRIVSAGGTTNDGGNDCRGQLLLRRAGTVAFTHDVHEQGGSSRASKPSSWELLILIKDATLTPVRVLEDHDSIASPDTSTALVCSSSTLLSATPVAYT